MGRASEIAEQVKAPAVHSRTLDKGHSMFYFFISLYLYIVNVEGQWTADRGWFSPSTMVVFSPFTIGMEFRVSGLVTSAFTH